jgi:hypothetical protein
MGEKEMSEEVLTKSPQIKRMIKSLLRPLKPVLKKILLKFLAFLDDSFLSSAPDKARVVDSLKLDSSSALIVNEDGVIPNQAILNLNIDSIWPNKKAGHYEKLIKDYLKVHLALALPFADQLDLYKQTKKILASDLLEKTDYPEGAVPSMIEDLDRHLLEASQNRKAYAAGGPRSANTIFWPNPERKDNPRSIFGEIPYAKKFPFVSKNTPIGSAGSCFAMEIARWLQKENFNYIVTESVVDEETMASARWGTIFNVPSFRQLVERAFGLRTTPKILFTAESGGKQVFSDPFREDILFQSTQDYEKDYNEHLSAVQRALLDAEVFIMTLGMNEVWYLKSDGSVFSRAPWRISSGLVEKRVLSVEENVMELQKMLDIWRQYNPKLKLILSVSPVPLHATFRSSSQHVIAANCHSKATLRVAAEEFAAKNSDVYYFPSYESVMYCTEKPWENDQRHVSRLAVERVMNLFNTIFVKT